MAPIPGQYMEYHIAIGRDQTSSITRAEILELPVLDRYERIYIKESIGNFLGLLLAAPRVGTFVSENGSSNAGRDFAYRRQRGSLAYRFGLLAGTEITVVRQERQSDGSIKFVEDTVKPREFQLSLPRTVSVAEVIQWVRRGSRLQPDGSVVHSLDNASGGEGNENSNNGFAQISYIITPRDRKHTIRGMLDNSVVPVPSRDVNLPGQRPLAMVPPST